jgi:DNA repair exonuclease SbcCD ATPase subunit
MLALQQVERRLEFELPALQSKAARAQTLEAALAQCTPPEALRALLAASRAAARARADLDAAPDPDAGEDPAAEDARLADLETALQTLHRKEGELAQTETRLAQLEQELENLPAAPPYPGLGRESLQLLRAACQASMDEARGRLQEAQRLQGERERLQRELASLQGEAKQLEQTLAQRREEYQRQAALREEDALPPAGPGAALPEGDYPLARHWLEQARRKTQLGTALQQALQDRHAAAAELAEAQRALQTRQRQRGILEEARAARDFLSPEGSVKRILERVLQRILRRANPLAQELQLGLQFRMDANLEILAVQTRHGRTLERPADELGCGKATLAGMCFTLSAAQLLFPTLRTLIFDEPSAPLQSHLKKHFAAFLTRLSRYEAGHGFAQARQIIVVEHDENVAAACDQIIPVG